MLQSKDIQYTCIRYAYYTLLYQAVGHLFHYVSVNIIPFLPLFIGTKDTMLLLGYLDVLYYTDMGIILQVIFKDIKGDKRTEIIKNNLHIVL